MEKFDTRYGPLREQVLAILKPWLTDEKLSAEKDPIKEYAAFSGSDDDDEIAGTEENDEIEGLLGDDRISGNGGNDKLFGGLGNDWLDGGDGDDQLFGGYGDNTLIGGPGADLLDGGIGRYDVADYSSSTGAVMVDLVAGRGYSGDARGDILVSIEQVKGSQHDDFIWGDDKENKIWGNDGNDQLWGEGGRDILYGGRGDDLLIEGEGNGTLNGGTGNDTLLGGEGNDVLRGEFGDDRLYGGEGDDELEGGAGADLLDGGDGLDTAIYRWDGRWSFHIDLERGVSGGDARGDSLISIENISVRGGGNNHTINGDAGNNRLWLHDSSGSSIDGRGGDDRIGLKNSENGRIDGGDGIDQVKLIAEDATGRDVDIIVDLSIGIASYSSTYATNSLLNIENVTTSYGDDELFGDAANNRLDGDSGNDELHGRGGDDILFGDSGNDWLNGGNGNDDLFGGSGADTFVFITGINDTDQDAVFDFEIGVDQLDLSQTRIDDFAEFLQRSDQNFSDTVIDTGNGAIALLDITLTDLSASDFIF